MAKKNTAFTVTASVIIASSIFGAQGVEAASHKVKSGDSLWSISQKYNTSISNLKSWNNLNNSLIFPNQVLEVGNSKSSSTTNKKPANSTSNTNKSQSIYTVKSGDTLGKIANTYNISLNNLMKWNNLSTTLIFPGDKLKVGKNAVTSNSTSSNNNNSNAGVSNNTNKPAVSAGNTYTVKSGDTLGYIAKAHGMSLSKLMQANNLSSHLIFPGDKLNVGTKATSGNSNNAPKPKPNKNNNNSSNASSNTNVSSYTIKSGDTLGKIAANHGVSVNNLMKWNNLSSHMIYPGEKLTLKGASANTSNNQSTSNNSSSNNNVSNTTNSAPPASGGLINIAKSVMGTPYVWGGTTPGGFDCSGFIYWAYNQSGKSMSRLNTEGYYNRSFMVDKPSVGDLVFFEGTYKSGISHMGIYVGNNSFIHAGESRGVEITSLDNPYWSKHFHSYKRFY